MLKISDHIRIPDAEITISAIRAQGAGGQNVNKVASAVHLRFDIRASSLPEVYKKRLLALADQRITRGGVVVIKAQQHRSQEKNREAALKRLRLLINSVAVAALKRRPTRPTPGARQKRLERKLRHGKLKAMRAKVKPPAF